MTAEEYMNLELGDIITYDNKEYKVVEALLDFNFGWNYIVERNGERAIFNIGSIRLFNLKHKEQ